MADERYRVLPSSSLSKADLKAPDRSWMRIGMISGIGVILAIGLVFTIGTVVRQKLDPAQQSLHRHAANAAVVMENEPAGTSGIDLARSVVGKGTDDSVTVLAASGTRHHGEVLLRIDVTVQPTSEFGSTSRAVGCFAYSFNYDASPSEVSCPDKHPLRLPPPEPSTSTTVS